MAEGSLTIYYWCQETAQRPFETGIERVVRGLARKLSQCGAEIVPVGWDTRSRQVVSLPTKHEPEGRPLDTIVGNQAIFLVPEIAWSLIGAGLDPVLLGRAYGFYTVGFVHDLIPMKRAADYPPEAVVTYRRYFRQLARADLVLTTTSHVAADLRDFLAAEGLPAPLVEIVPLPAEMASAPRHRDPPPPRDSGDPFRIVTVSSWEPRKNIARLLRALGRVCAEGRDISLDLVGRRAGFRSHDDTVLSLAATLPSVRVRGTIADADLVALYAGCHASIYPSLEEGFGLPILESLWLGRPCLCHDGSSMAEIAPGGGTALLDMSDEDAIVAALTRLALEPRWIDQLARDAIDRPLRTWTDFAEDLLGRIASRRPGVER